MILLKVWEVPPLHVLGDPEWQILNNTIVREPLACMLLASCRALPGQVRLCQPILEFDWLPEVRARISSAFNLEVSGWRLDKRVL